MKKIVSIFVAMFMSMGMLIAAEPKSCGLTDADVRNYCKNFDSITKEFEAIDVDDNGKGSAEDIVKAEKILEKYGISGPNRLIKVSVISQCMIVIAYDAEAKKDTTAGALLGKLGTDPMKKYRDQLNTSDYNKVKNNSAEVLKVIEKKKQTQKSKKK